MKRPCVILLGVFLTLSLPVLASASLVTGADSFNFTDDYILVESNVSQCDPVASNPLNGVTLTSAAYYSSTSDSYLYLYQLINDSPDSATIHRLAVTEFEGLQSGTQTGYLDANPGIFQVGTAAPLFSDISVVDSTVGFYLEVLVDEVSKVMFVASSLAPSDEYATALVQNSGQANGQVIVPSMQTTPVPEPVTMALLGLGGLLIGNRKK